MIPAEIKKHKIKGTEIKKINGYYYVYSMTSKWHKEEKRAKKVSGKTIGKITERDGFIPNKNYEEWCQKRIKKQPRYLV